MYFIPYCSCVVSHFSTSVHCIYCILVSLREFKTLVGWTPLYVICDRMLLFTYALLICMEFVEIFFHFNSWKFNQMVCCDSSVFILMTFCSIFLAFIGDFSIRLLTNWVYFIHFFLSLCSTVVTMDPNFLGMLFSNLMRDFLSLFYILWPWSYCFCTFMH